VTVVYELRRLGTPPEFLPAYERAPSRAGDVLGVGRILAAVYDGQRGSACAYWVGSGGDGGYYDASGNPLRKTFLKSPLNYRRISSRFSRARLHPVTRKVVPHHGVDYAADPGTPVVASADGSVVSVGWDGPLGRAVRIRHGSQYVTVYGHLSRFGAGIRPGVRVKQNQVVGYVGATGRATGPHLHYTVLERGRAIDPLRMDNPPIEPLDPALRPELQLAVERWTPLLDGSRAAPGVLSARLAQP
jgi:murein DD-endopeptidase MepM/ murein hydrolase activator NlpD